MTSRKPPRLALALLERCVPDSASLAGDLLEEFEQRQSRLWFWWQVLAAIWIASSERSGEIRPLRLVDLQPSDAAERARRLNLRFRPVNLTASPIYGIGGLGLVMLSVLVTLVVPGAWWLMLASVVAGIALGVFMIARQRRRLG
ncbi:MAG TPA: hypothetical protein VK886_03955 [Vicinamibacterales bacterium]|nr:hypothetical protein [Vicinamibacterales bacterium]